MSGAEPKKARLRKELQTVEVGQGAQAPAPRGGPAYMGRSGILENSFQA